MPSSTPRSLVPARAQCVANNRSDCLQGSLHCLQGSDCLQGSLQGTLKNARMSVITDEKERMRWKTVDQRNKRPRAPVKSPLMGAKAARRASSTSCLMSAKTAEGETCPEAALAAMSTELCSIETARLATSSSPSPSTKSTLDQLCSAWPAAARRFGASAHTTLHQGMLSVSCQPGRQKLRAPQR